MSARRWLVVTLLLNACSFGAPDAAFDDGEGDADGSSIDASTDSTDGGDGMVIDAPPDVMPDPEDDDDDDDTILDEDDNCPLAPNADQRNHDGDALGDKCDPCPHLTANTDTDGDGVGDACDPSPTTPGDRWIAFHGFYADADIDGWARDGTWTVNNMLQAEVTSAASGGQQLTVPGSLARVYVAVRYVFRAFPNNDGAFIGVTAGQGGGRFYSCGIGRGNGSNSSSLVGEWDGNMGFDLFDTDPYGSATSASSAGTLELFIANGQARCSLASTAGSPTQDSLSGPAGRTDGTVGFATNNGARAAYDYIFVVEPHP